MPTRIANHQIKGIVEIKNRELDESQWRIKILVNKIGIFPQERNTYLRLAQFFDDAKDRIRERVKNYE